VSPFPRARAMAGRRARACRGRWACQVAAGGGAVKPVPWASARQLFKSDGKENNLHGVMSKQSEFSHVIGHMLCR